MAGINVFKKENDVVVSMIVTGESQVKRFLNKGWSKDNPEKSNEKPTSKPDKNPTNEKPNKNK